MPDSEAGRGGDQAGVAAGMMLADRFNWDVVWTCEKWSEHACAYARRRLGLASTAEVRSAVLRTLIPQPDLGVVEVHGNLLCNAGIQRMLDLLIAAGGQALDATHSRMGVGDSTTAATAADTDLGAAAGSSHRQFVTMNATFPSRASQTNTWQADFTSGLANFAWQEWGIDAGTANGTTVTAPLLNHKVESLGTKATGTWTLSGAITVT